MQAQTKMEIKERPILFSGEMVKAILDGRKTQTRRVVKPQPDFVSPADGLPYPYVIHEFVRDNKIVTLEGPEDQPNSRFVGKPIRCPYGKPGDRLWVREAHSVQPCNCCVRYRADENLLDAGEKWRPSIFMLRRFSRITLKITNVRIERLQDISEENAKAEGVEAWSNSGNLPSWKFHGLWDRINGKKHPWESNPWVWVVEFRHDLNQTASVPTLAGSK